MFKNVATKVALFAFDTTTGAPKTGDAANITAYVSKDYAATNVLADTSASELESTNAKGWYLFDVAQAETNADALLFTAKSTTANVSVVGQYIHTTPNRFTTLVIDAAGLADANMVKVGPTGSGTAQTAGDIMADTNDIQTRLPAALVSGRMDASVGAYQSGQAPLQPTVAGRTLDVSAGGEAGVDWANVGSPTTTLNLSGTSTKALEPTTAGRTLDVTATGEAGIDWANIGGPTTTVNLSGTTIKTATDIATATTLIQADTDDIQTRLPAALTAGGNMKADALALSGDTTAADNAESFFDGTGYAGTNNVIPTVTTVGTVNALANDSITAAAIATDAIGALELAAGAASEIATAVRTELTTELGRIDVAVSTRASQTSVDTIDDFVDTEVGSIKAVTDKLDNTLENTSDGYIFTANSLQQAPTGGSAPSAAAIADAVWEEQIGDHSGTTGSTAEALAAASAAGDPWATALPGAYSAGQAGKIVGDNLNATVSSRATQTSVDDLPTNAELATALGTADDAVLAQVALVKAKTDNLPSDPADESLIIAATDAIAALIGAPAGASLSADVAAVKSDTGAIKAKTDNLPSDPADASVVAGQIAAVPAATWTVPVDGATTAAESMAIQNSVLAGNSSGHDTLLPVFRDLADTKDRVSADLDAFGNRSNSTTDGT